MIRNRNLAALFLACLVLVSGCSTTPVHDWKSSLNPQPGKALVVFYFTHISGVGGTIPSFCVYANDNLITSELRPDSFFTYQADPGELNIYSKIKFGSSPVLLLDQATIGQVHMHAEPITVEANQIYYLEFGPAAFGPARFKKVVPREVGEEKIKAYDWINPS